ncbi:MAG TPA: peptidylprolyl isomerase [Longimicrobiaceae bacterium]|nr:peptidylprolyl isomerase [Longimicrobiaceae bacterium]
MKTATFQTNKGTFVAELYPDVAPNTVESFERLAQDGFYDGIVFHRFEPGFVLQGGDPLTKELPLEDRRIGTGGPGYTVKLEVAGNPHRHTAGALSMARSNHPDSAGSQFFVVLDEANARHLDGKYTVFGQVVRGMDVVRQLRRGDAMEKVTVADTDLG